MLALENAEEVLQILDRYTKQKSKDIPPELDEYLNYVAKTGDTVYRWPTVQYLFREKLISVIKEFHDTTASIEDLPQCPNVDPFNYESMKSTLLERLDLFSAAPFTIQRLCELLTDPKKHYTRLDKFMRALEKNILVVSTIEPGVKRADTEENGDESTINGDFLGDIIIDMNVKQDILKSDEGVHADIDVVAIKDVPTVESQAGSSSATEVHSNGNGLALESLPVEVAIEVDEHIDIEKIGKGDDTPMTISDEVDPKIDVAHEVKEAPSTTEIKNDDNASVVEAQIEKEVFNDKTQPVEGEAAKIDSAAEANLVATEDNVESATELKTGEEETDNASQITTTESEITSNAEAAILENLPTIGVTATEKPIPDETPVEKALTPKHERDENDVDELDANSAKKIRLDITENNENEDKSVEEEAVSQTKPAEDVKISDLNDTSTVSETTSLVENSETSKPIELLSSETDTVSSIDKKIETERESIVETAQTLATVSELATASNAVTASSIAEPDAEESGNSTVIPKDEPPAEIAAANLAEEASIPVKLADTIIDAEPIQISEAISPDTVEPVVAGTPSADEESMAVEDAEAAATISSTDATETTMEAVPTKSDDEKMEIDEANVEVPMDL